MDAAQIEERIALALKMHNSGYNCAQCVSLVTCDLVGMEQDVLFRLTEGLGGGMGGFTQTCGALSGGIPIVSSASSNGMEKCNTKLKTYGHVRDMVERFEERCGGTLCCDLLSDEPDLRIATCQKWIVEGVRVTIETLENIKEGEVEQCK